MFRRSRETQVPYDSDQQLITEFLDEDPHAVATIMSWINDVLNFQGWGSRVEKHDVRSESLLALCRNLRSGAFEKRGGGLRAYVHGICSNLCLRALRQSYTRREIELPEVDIPSQNPAPDAILEERDRILIARKVLAALEPECRRLIIWRHFEQRSHTEIAQLTRKSEAATRTQLSRCLKRAVELVQTYNS